MKIEGQLIGNHINTLNGHSGSEVHLGDKLTAQIVNIEQGQVVLEKQNGDRVNAVLVENLNANIGDVVDLEVVGLRQGQIILKVVSNESQQNLNSLMVALSNSQVPITEKNLELANFLFQNQIPVTKENLQAMLMGMTKFKDVSIENLLFLLGSEIPINEQNIEALKHLQEKKQSIPAHLDKIQELLSQLENKEVAREILNKINQLDKVIMEIATEAKTPKEPEILSMQQEGFNPSQQDKYAKEPTIQNKTILDKEPIIQHKTVLDSEGNNNEDATIRTITQYVLEVEDADFHESLLKALQSDRPTSNLSKLIEGFPQHKEFLLSLLENETDFDQIINKLTMKLREDISEDGIKSTMQDLKQNISQLLLHNDSDIRDAEVIKGLYKDVALKLSLMKQIVEQGNTLNGEQLLQSVDQLQNKLSFIQEMNKYHSFIHFPLTLQGENTPANLYVLKKKKSKYINPNDVTAFLSLDTKNIGLIEVFIHKINNTISCQFQCDKHEAIGIIQKKVHQLHQVLKQKGYSLEHIQYKEIQEKTEIPQLNQTENKKLKYSFDMRV